MNLYFYQGNDYWPVKSPPHGLDSAMTFQIVTCIQQWTHTPHWIHHSTQVFDPFDDIILMAEGNIAYQGPSDNVVEFFEHCGFRCPPRKCIADFLQEVCIY